MDRPKFAIGQLVHIPAGLHGGRRGPILERVYSQASQTWWYRIKPDGESIWNFREPELEEIPGEEVPQK